MIAVDKGMTGGRCRREETKLYRMDQKNWSGINLLGYVNDEITKILKMGSPNWENINDETITCVKNLCNN